MDCRPDPMVTTATCRRCTGCRRGGRLLLGRRAGVFSGPEMSDDTRPGHLGSGRPGRRLGGTGGGTGRPGPVAGPGWGRAAGGGPPAFRSYYGMPIIKEPVWDATISRLIFSSVDWRAPPARRGGAELRGRPNVARAIKPASMAAGLSGMPWCTTWACRRAFQHAAGAKATSPMSVGAWLLAAYAPMSATASFSATTGRLRRLGVIGTAGAAALGPGVATYTAALISNTAVPAWHGGYRHMPFLFAASSASAAAGLGMAAAPLHETAPVRHLGIGAAVAELALMQLMKKAMGEAAGAFAESHKGRRYERIAAAVTGADIGVAALAGRRSRLASALAGVSILAGSAFTRFAIFEAGLTSAENPRYTIVPQRRRVQQRQGQSGGA